SGIENYSDGDCYQNSVRIEVKTSSINSSSSKGEELEFLVFRFLKNTMKIDCQRVKLSGPYGDGGINIFENYMGYLILVQCKNYNEKVDVSNIRKFEGVLSRYPKCTILGIFVTFAVDRYTKIAIERADSKDPEECIIDEIVCKIEQKIHIINEKVEIINKN
ncbi:4319_t:CDS:2, partial [Gigaspora margarita]